jgi:hypothetical protein
MEIQGFRNVMQQLIHLHQELLELQRQGEQLAHAAGQAFEDLMKLVHPASSPSTNAAQLAL